MNIVFQSGEFYNQSSDILNFLGGLLGVIISGLVSVLIYRSGAIRDKKREELKRISEVERFRKTYCLQLQNAINSINKQITGYKEFSEKIAANPLEQIVPIEHIHTDIKRLSATPTIELVDLFQTLQLSTEDYTITVNSIDFLALILDKISEDTWATNVKNYERLATKVIEIRNEILGSAADYINERRKITKEYLKEPLTAFFDNLILDYHSNTDGRPNMEYDYENLITPVKQVLLDNFPDEDASVPLLKKAKVAGDIIFSIRDNNKTFGENIKTITESIQESKEKLEIILVKLQNYA